MLQIRVRPLQLLLPPFGELGCTNQLEAFGIKGGRAMAVATEATAVRTLTDPANQYTGVQSVHISTR